MVRVNVYGKISSHGVCIMFVYIQPLSFYHRTDNAKAVQNSSNFHGLNPFTPKFLKWTSISEFDTFMVANRGFSQKSMTEWQTV